MKLELFIESNDEGYESHTLYANGNEVYSAYPMWECPEDATVERDLHSGHDIINLMEKAYEAGKNGEEFTIKYLDENEE